MPLDPSIFNQVGNFRSVQDYDQQAQAVQLNKLHQLLLQNQVSQIPLQNQLQQLQLSGAQLGNDKQAALLNIVRRITGADNGQPAQGGLGGVLQPQAMGASTSSPQAMPSTQAGTGLNFRDVVGLKTLGGPDLSADFKMEKEGFFHPSGGFQTDVNGNRTYLPKVPDGMVIDPATGAVSNAPGFATSQAELARNTAAATKAGENSQTLSPLDRLGPDGRPLAMTVGQVVSAVGAPTLGAPNPGPSGSVTALDGLSPQQQLVMLHDMKARGIDMSQATINGQPAMTPIQGMLDDARKSGPEGIAALQARVLPNILAMQDPQMRQKALAQFTADIQAPHGTPVHMAGSGGLQFMGPAELEAQKVEAKNRAEAATKPAVTYSDDVAKSAAKYKTELDSSVSTGQDLMQRINEAKSALDQFKPGMGAESRLQVARLAQSLGMPDSLVTRLNNGDVAAKQEFQKLGAQSAMESLKQSLGTAGRITQAEFAVFQKNNPNIELDPNAIQKIYDFQTKVYQRTLAEQQGYAKYIGNGGNPAEWQAKWANQQDPTGSGNIGGTRRGGFTYIGPVK